MVKPVGLVLAALMAALGLVCMGVDAIQPGAYGAVSRDAVQGIVDKVYPPILEAMKHVQIEPMSGVESGFKYELWNFKLNTVDIRAIEVQTQGNLRVDIRDVVLRASMDWKYRKKGVPWIPRGSGWLEANLEAGDIGGTFSVGTTQTPDGTKPVVTLAALTVDISKVKIKVHGSMFSWLYNLIIGLFKNKIKNAVVNFVRTSVTNAVNTASAKIIDTAVFRKPFSKWGVLDYSLTHDLAFSNGLIVAPLSGEVVSIETNTTDGNTPRLDVSFPGSSRMFSFTFSSFVVNSGLHVYHESGRFNRYYTAASHPALFPLGFTTDAYALLIPALSRQFPGAAMTYRFSGRQQSTVSMSDSGINWASKSLLAAFVAGATPDADTPVFNIVIDLAAAASVTARDDNPSHVPTLYITLQSVVPTFTVEDSTVGPIDASLLNALVQSLVADVIVPAFNVVFEDGIPILAVKGFSFANMSVRTITDALVFETDVQYEPPAAVASAALDAANVTDVILSDVEIAERIAAFRDVSA